MSVMIEVQVILTHSKVVSSVHRVIVLQSYTLLVRRLKTGTRSKLSERRTPKLGAHALNTYSEIVDKYKAICNARDITMSEKTELIWPDIKKEMEEPIWQTANESSVNKRPQKVKKEKKKKKENIKKQNTLIKIARENKIS